MSEIVFQGKGEPAIPIPAGETWTIKYAAYDAFGLIGLIESPTVEVDTLEVLVDVPPASIDITKFATGITPVGLVDVLPTVAGYTGSPVVLLSTDGQIYRLVSGAWTRAVPAVAVTGTLTAAQIATIASTQITGTLTAAQIASVNAAAIAGTLTAAQIASINAAQVVGTLVASQIASVNASAIAGTLAAAQIASVNASAITGTITSTQVADDAITTPKIATGAITADEIAAGAVVAGRIAANAVTAGTIAANAVTAGTIAADAVTATQIAAGAVTASEIAANAITAVHLSANSVTAAAIAANTITADQIAASTITATQIAAGTITAANIAAGTITAGQIAAGTITATQIAADTITAGNIAANAITSSELSANSVVAGKIAAGAITATEISAGSLTADRFVSGGRANMLHNGALYNADVNEALEFVSATANFGAVANLAYVNPNSDWSINGEIRGTVGHNKGNDGTAGNYVDYAFAYRNNTGAKVSFIPVNRNQWYEFNARVAVHRTRADILIFWYDSAFALLGTTTASTVQDSTNLSNQGGRFQDNYTQLWTRGQAPATTVWARAVVRRYVTNAGQTDSWMWVARGFFSETESTATQPTRWAAPGTTLIQGGSIATGTVNADQIAANAITAGKIAANAITADKITVGSLSAISANLGAITGGSININNKFIVDSAGNVTLQSSPTGPRLVLTNSRLEVYDADRLRVRLGIW